MAERIAIVVDSTADLPNGMVESLDLHVIPIHIYIDGDDYLHGVDITNRDVINRLREDREVKTSPPFPGEYSDFYEKLEPQYDRIFSFHVSADLSNCFTSAQSATSLLFEEVAKKIIFLDTRSATIGQGQIVKKAAELIQAGLAADQVPAQLTGYVNNSFMLFTVDNLYWLKRAGKANPFSAFLGGVLDIKPIIGLRDGQLEPVGKHRGSASALDECIRLTTEKSKEYQAGHDIWLGYGDSPQKALYVRDHLAAKLGRNFEEISIVEIGPTILAHTGPDALCVAILDK